jgi:hypothetical protein
MQPNTSPSGLNCVKAKPTDKLAIPTELKILKAFIALKFLQRFNQYVKRDRHDMLRTVIGTKFNQKTSSGLPTN